MLHVFIFLYYLVTIACHMTMVFDIFLFFRKADGGLVAEPETKNQVKDLSESFDAAKEAEAKYISFHTSLSTLFKLK